MFFEDPKKALWYKSDLLKVYLICSVLESEWKPYTVDDIIIVGKDNTERFKQVLQEYFNWLEPDTLKFLQKKIELIEITKSANITVTWDDGKLKNVAYELIENLSKLVWFKFWTQYTNTVKLNMKSLTLFLKKNSFHEDFINFIYGLQTFDTYIKNNKRIYSEDVKDVFIMKFVSETIYPFFHDGSSDKNIMVFLAWFKVFLENYENMLLGIKVLIYYIKNIEWRTIQKSETWTLYNSYWKSLNQILNYSWKNYENAIYIINECVKSYKKWNLFFTLKTIVKDMYKVQIENKKDLIENNKSYDSIFISKMEELKISKDLYGEYYKIYLEEGIVWLN